MSLAALEDRSLPVYGDGLYVRDWIFVEDFCRGLVAAFERGEAGRVYNFGTGLERTNLEIVEEILRILGKPRELISFCEDRPGHDRRYSMDCSRAREELEWQPEADFTDELKKTVLWYRTRLVEGRNHDP
jgi:dTDP-glucose 4,6-dehydratase